MAAILSRNVKIALVLPVFYTPFVSMAVFWLDATNCGERLGFGVTTLLAVRTYFYE